MLINSLIKLLNYKLKAFLVGVKLPVTFSKYITIIDKQYNNILRLTPKSTL